MLNRIFCVLSSNKNKQKTFSTKYERSKKERLSNDIRSIPFFQSLSFTRFVCHSFSLPLRIYVSDYKLLKWVFCLCVLEEYFQELLSIVTRYYQNKFLIGRTVALRTFSLGSIILCPSNYQLQCNPNDDNIMDDYYIETSDNNYNNKNII